MEHLLCARSVPIGFRWGLSSFAQEGDGGAEFEGDGDTDGLGVVVWVMIEVETKHCVVAVDAVCDSDDVTITSFVSLFMSGSFQIIGLRACVATCEKKLFSTELC